MLKFNPIVLITQPRELPEAIDSVKKYVKYPKAWFKGYTEPEVTKKINQYVKETNYSHYIICADDVIVNSQIFEDMVKYINIFSNHKETSQDILTGWCNLNIDPSDNSLGWESNVAEKRLTLKNGVWPLKCDYKFSPIRDILSRKGLIRTYLASFALSCVSRDVLMNYSLAPYMNGQAADHRFSRRVTADGIKIWTTPKMFVKHLRERSTAHLKRNWIVGKVNPTVTEEL